MRITKDMARIAAEKMTENKNKRIQHLSKTISDIVTEEYRKTVPAEVISCFKKHPSYIRTTTYLQLVGNGFNYESVTIAESPVHSSRLTLSEPTAKNVSVLMQQLSKAQKERKSLIGEISSAIYNLRTLARVTEIFPEALSFIPAKPKTELAVNIDSLRAKL